MTWNLEAHLTAGIPNNGDEFGSSVAIAGDTLLVGAPWSLGTKGAAYVFVRDGTSWTQQAKLFPSGPGHNNELFGFSVAVEGDTALIGARHLAGGTGAAYVWVRSGTTWSEQQELTASEGGDGFGNSVALSGDTALIGVREDTLHGFSDAGSAYVFVRSGTTWSEEQKLIASDHEVFDYFGGSVALEGDTALIGAIGGDNLGPSKYAGAAYVFVRNGTSWSEEAKLSASDGLPGDHFGAAVALRENKAVVGAHNDETEGGLETGSAYLFTRNGATWDQQRNLVASDGADNDNFGYSIAVWGDTAAVGASGHGLGQGFDNAGAAYLFELSFPFVSGYCTAGTSASGCQARLSGCGVPSASAPAGFEVQASSVEGGKDGLFFFGTQGQQANPWGNGSSFQCVVPPVVRTALLGGTGTAGACDGALSRDLNALWCPACPQPAKNPGAGAVVQAQLWYRDPASTSNRTTSLSDAIEFTLDP